MKIPDIKTAEGRTELAKQLKAAIHSGTMQKGNLPDRWSRLHSMANQEPTDLGSEYDVAAIARTFPLLSPKIDQLVAAVCGPVLASSPYFTAIGFGKSIESAKAAQNLVHFLLVMAEFKSHFRRAVRRTAVAEPTIYHCYFKDDKTAGYGYCGPCIETIPPDDFIIYPAYMAGISEAQVVGDRYWMRLGDIHEKARIGEFYDECRDIKRSDLPMADQNTSAVKDDPFGGGISGDDRPIECWRIIVKDDKGGYHLCRYTEGYLLSCEPYGATKTMAIPGMEPGEPTFTPYSRPGYFESILHEAETAKFYRQVPFGHKIQQLQLAFDKLMNCLLDGAEIDAAPPIVATGGLGEAGKLIDVRAGSILSLPGSNVKIEAFPSRFNPGMMPQLVQLLQELADGASRISQAGMGQQFKSDTTATEAEGVLAGQQMGLDEYRDNATKGPADMCAFIVELAGLHFDQLLEHYGESLPVQRVEELTGTYYFEPTGKTIQSSPQAVVQKLQLARDSITVLVQAGLVTPQALIMLTTKLIEALDLPFTTREIEEMLYAQPPQQPIAPGGAQGVPAEQPGMDSAQENDPEFIRGLLDAIGGAQSNG